MMKLINPLIFIVLMTWNSQVFSRENFLYDYKEVSRKVAEGTVSFRLFGTNTEEDEPKKIRVRKNPYTLSIRYISDVPFIEASITGLQFSRDEDKNIVFNSSEQVSKRLGGKEGAGYAGFYYGEQLKGVDLEHLDYSVEGVLSVKKSDGNTVTYPFKAIFKADYKEKCTWDFWEGIMGI